jgi:hypothetical protein
MVAAFALAAPAGALADGLNAETVAAQPTGASTAMFTGSVTGTTGTTSYSFAYAGASSQWCTSQGTSGSPTETGSQTTSSDTDVNADVSGLTPDTAYCMALTATDASSTAQGIPTTFTAGAPTVATDDVSGTSGAVTTLYGEIDPAGQSTAYQAQYALSSSQWCTSLGASGLPTATTAAQTIGGSGQDADQEVSVALSGMSPGVYCAELVATNVTGSASGGQIVFQAGMAAVSDTTAAATGATTATVTTQIDPAGQLTYYEVAYDVDGSAWCTSWGTSGTSPSYTSQTGTLTAADDASHVVSIPVTGLTPGTAYCMEVLVANTSTSSNGPMVELQAGLPAVSDTAISSSAATTASVAAQVNPSEQSTTYLVQYDLQNSDWCTSGGADGSPAVTTASQTVPASDDQPHAVSVALTGLTPDSAYCAQLVASNASGTQPTGQEDFVAGTSSAQTGAATPTGASTETIAGQIDPAGQTTAYTVQYDDAESAWCQTGDGAAAHAAPSATLGATDDAAHDVSVDLTGLVSGEDYCAELVTSNGSGSSAGQPVTFTAGAPAAVSGDTQPTGASTATVAGQVDPAGTATTYSVAYDLATSAWCESGAGDPQFQTDAVALPASDGQPHDVSVTVSGLSAGTAYCAVLVAGNGVGTTAGDQVTFATEGTSAPAVGAAQASATGQTTATLAGSVDPSGLATSYQFVDPCGGRDRPARVGHAERADCGHDLPRPVGGDERPGDDVRARRDVRHRRRDHVDHVHDIDDLVHLVHLDDIDHIVCLDDDRVHLDDADHLHHHHDHVDDQRAPDHHVDHHVDHHEDPDPRAPAGDHRARPRPDDDHHDDHAGREHAAGAVDDAHRVGRGRRGGTGDELAIGDRVCEAMRARVHARHPGGAGGDPIRRVDVHRLEWRLLGRRHLPDDARLPPPGDRDLRPGRRLRRRRPLHARAPCAEPDRSESLVRAGGPCPTSRPRPPGRARDQGVAQRRQRSGDDAGPAGGDRAVGRAPRDRALSPTRPGTASTLNVWPSTSPTRHRLSPPRPSPPRPKPRRPRRSSIPRPPRGGPRRWRTSGGSGTRCCAPGRAPSTASTMRCGPRWRGWVCS